MSEIEREEEYREYLLEKREIKKKLHPDTVASYCGFLSRISRDALVARPISAEIVKDNDAVESVLKKLKNTGIIDASFKNCQSALRAYFEFVNNSQIDIAINRTSVGRFENGVEDLYDPPMGCGETDRALRVTNPPLRNQRLRDFVVRQAEGKCEYCHDEGFTTSCGDPYLESHHIILRSKGGHDSVDNLIALCPKHHREAHYGRGAESLEEEFIEIVKRRQKKVRIKSG